MMATMSLPPILTSIRLIASGQKCTTEKFPKSSFQGKITGFNAAVAGKQQVRATGSSEFFVQTPLNQIL